MLVPLGAEFSKDVLGAGPSGFGVYITVLGVGVAIGVIALSVLQRRVNKLRVFSTATLFSGITLVLAASSSSLLVSGAFVLLLGLCAGAVYVLGFTLLHENVDDELRGRAFSGLYTLVRMCVLLSFVLGPFLATLLHGLSRAVLGPDRTLVVGDVSFFLPGVRLALFLAGAIMVGAGVASILSLRLTNGKEPAPAEVEPC
jgi:dTMP kinase